MANKDYLQVNKTYSLKSALSYITDTCWYPFKLNMLHRHKYICGKLIVDLIMMVNQMTNTSASTKGQAIYSKSVLLIYDLWVLGFSNTFLWRCPTSHLRTEFTRHVSNNHLDVGVGTGYYLDKCLNDDTYRLALLDLNANSLDVASKRVRRFYAESYQKDILLPLTLSGDKFHSVSIQFLIHCLPGSMQEKSIIFKHLLPYLHDDAVLFGSTILGAEIEKNWLANKMMALYNRQGIFCNTKDTLAQLREGLETYFAEVDIHIKGAVAVFYGKRPKQI